MSAESILHDALCQPTPAIRYYLDRMLAQIYPSKAIVQVSETHFDVREFERDGHCSIKDHTAVHSERIAQFWAKDKPLWHRDGHCWLEVTWQGQHLEVIQISVPAFACDKHYQWVSASSKEIAESFYHAVCLWNSQVRGEILVFQEGQWGKSSELFTAIQNSTLDNLVLPPGVKDQIVGDFRSFFDSREIYERYGIPWKRGVLFIGPPGNGKTHTIKALINSLGQDCLYVRSLVAQYSTPYHTIHEVFRRARETTPCILVFEDLDALIDDNNRSYFLNELDGFASNAGIVVVATTNHPERIDPAILNRPSRFDRKFHFDLPGLEERKAFLRLWSGKLEVPLQLSESEIARAAGAAEEFSFAYLKELCLSSLMAWINSEPKPRLVDCMLHQAPELKEQMRTEPEPKAAPANPYAMPPGFPWPHMMEMPPED